MPEIISRKYQRHGRSHHPEYHREYYYLRRGLPVPSRRTPETKPKRIKMTLGDCAICGATYRKIGNAATCSPPCGLELKQARDAFNLRLARKSYGERPCAICGVIFKIFSKRHRHCSRRCFYVAFETIGPLQPNGEKQWLRKAQVMNKNLRRLIRRPNLDHSSWLRPDPGT